MLTDARLQWKPKLNASLHDGHVFVLGLKRDLRPSYPTLGLSFLPTREPATAEMVCHLSDFPFLEASQS
jgi:hypothetical protein